MNWSGNIYATIPSYLQNKAIFIHNRHRGGKTKNPEESSNWENCSTNGTTNNNNVKQGAGVCFAAAETQQVFYSSSPKVCKHRAKTKTLPNLHVFGKQETFVPFCGYGRRRIENISAKKAQKHLSNPEQNKDMIRGLFVFPPAIPAKHKGAAERMYETAKEGQLGLSALHGSVTTFPNLFPFFLLPSYHNVPENSLLEVRADQFWFLKLCSMGYFLYHRSPLINELVRVC